MFKKLRYLVVFIIFVSVLFTLPEILDDVRPKPNQESESAPVPNDNEKPSDKEQDNGTNKEALVQEIYQLSTEGKVLQSPFVAGVTNINLIHEKWGIPEETAEANNAFYENYQDVTIGYANELVFDLRSYHEKLSEIHLEDLKQQIGDPDETRYYKDVSHDQIILVYHVNETYQLKWVLPNPTGDNKNPAVHHISVFTELDEKNNSQEITPELISKMSLDEKIGQMIITGITDVTINKNTKSLINQYKIGGIIFYRENLINPSQTSQLIKQLKAENSTNKLPLFLSIDQEGGRISRLPGGIVQLPTNKEIGSINNMEFSYKIGTLLGKELQAYGLNLDFAPVLDINSNPDNPVIGDRSFGDNAEIVSRLGTQTMRGIQSQGIISVVKHFPGHGDTSVDSHLQLPIVNKSLEDLYDLELIPFQQAIDNGADIIMSAHILLPKLDANYPASMSYEIITQLLRNTLHYDGVVITDDMTMKAITNNFEIGDAAVTSVKAGSDIILLAHDYDKITRAYEAIKTAVHNGEISEERINASVERIIKLKKKYELGNRSVQKVDIDKLNQQINDVLSHYMD